MNCTASSVVIALSACGRFSVITATRRRTELEQHQLFRLHSAGRRPVTEFRHARRRLRLPGRRLRLGLWRRLSPR